VVKVAVAAGVAEEEVAAAPAGGTTDFDNSSS